MSKINILLYPVFLPIIIGLVIFFIKKAERIIAILTSVCVLYFSVKIFLLKEIAYSVPYLPFGIDFYLRAYPFSSMCVLFASFLAFLICLYSIRSQRLSPNYFPLFLINLGVVNGAFLSNNFVLFILFWEMAAMMLYLLLKNNNVNSYKAATKAFYIVGFSDFCLLLGFILLWNLTGSFKVDSYALPIADKYTLLAFTLMTIGALAKAGAMPFHTWIPDAAENSDVEVMAYLPASLDKLLGIYLLARITTDFFSLSMNFYVSISLCFIGAFTVIAAVMMALVQHDLKKLLSYHAVSQVGYMVLGIGTGTAVGVLGGIFHLLNNSIYKTCLFLCAGSVEKKAGTTDLDKLGGLSKAMPVTFTATLIAALSISGVPPFNGFFSKWMIYQGLLQTGLSHAPLARSLVWIFLLIAVFGSALTLASFIKVLHSVFLGQFRTSDFRREPPAEVSWERWLPAVVLASVCVIFGIFAYHIPLKFFVLPSIPYYSDIPFSGIWQPSLATLLLIAGIIVGLFIYAAGTVSSIKRAPNYTYGEDPEIFRDGFPGTEFYLSISKAPPFSKIYKAARSGTLDFYDWGMGIAKIIADSFFICIDRLIENMYISVNGLIRVVSRFMSELQGGLLQIYLYWSLFGLMVMLLILCR